MSLKVGEVVDSVAEGAELRYNNASWQARRQERGRRGKSHNIQITEDQCGNAGILFDQSAMHKHVLLIS